MWWEQPGETCCCDWQKSQKIRSYMHGRPTVWEHISYHFSNKLVLAYCLTMSIVKQGYRCKQKTVNCKQNRQENKRKECETSQSSKIQY